MVGDDDDFRVATTTMNGGPPVSFQYDADGLPTAAGALTLTRDAQHGLLAGPALGSATSSQSYSILGELAWLEHSHGSNVRLQTSSTRDALGRITELTETVLGVTCVLVYGYDGAGRLATVTRDGGVVEAYEYDRAWPLSGEDLPMLVPVVGTGLELVDWHPCRFGGR